MKHDTQPRYLQAKAYLLGQIRALKAGANQLEPENTLTEKLGMSRETIRKAMSSLIQDGIITRWHGKGNFGHPSVTNMPMRIDLNSDFRRILTEAGYSVRSYRSEAVVRTPSPQMLRRMPEAQGQDVVSYRLDYFADDQLAVAGEVELLSSIVVKHPVGGEFTDSMNAFLKEHCITHSNHTTAWLLADQSAEVSERFSLRPDAPLLCWEEIYYNLHDQKMGYVKVFFNPDRMDLSLLLKF
jgi:GntR family transcriptional regulator